MFRVFAVVIFGLVGNAHAEWKKMAWPMLGADLPVWKPDGFDASKSYPAIVFYHGMGGVPTAEPIHRITGGKDFVLVGMTYRNQGRFQHTEREIADELGLLNALKKTLTRGLAVDPDRIFVAGFSKGGWHSALLLDRDRTLAGGLILGSGIAVARPGAPKFGRAVPIYIGCGRRDGNYPPSLGAWMYFRKLGAGVSQESWPETGHAIPESPPEGMRQWLRIQAAADGLEKEAADWIGGRKAELDGIEDPVEEWFALDEFVQRPFVKQFGSGAAAGAREKMAVLVRNPKVAAEQKWRNESRRILASESRDRNLTAMQAASRSYGELAVKAKGTRAGREAVQDAERTREMLKTAKVVVRPGEDQTVRPETTSEGPSGNPDRGPFFPPGIKVKPAR